MLNFFDSYNNLSMQILQCSIVGLALQLFEKTLIFQIVTRKVVPPSDFANRNGTLLWLENLFMQD